MDQSHKAINADSRSGETTCPKQHSDNLSLLIWSQILWLVHCIEANICLGANTWALGECTSRHHYVEGQGKIAFYVVFWKALDEFKEFKSNLNGRKNAFQVDYCQRHWCNTVRWTPYWNCTLPPVSQLGLHQKWEPPALKHIMCCDKCLPSLCQLSLKRALSKK